MEEHSAQHGPSGSGRVHLVAGLGAVLVIAVSVLGLLLVAGGDDGGEAEAIGSSLDASTRSTTTSSTTSTTSTTRPATTTTTTTPPTEPTRPTVDEVPVPAPTTDPLFSQRTVVRDGTGTVAAAEGDTVVFRFVGRLPDGVVFVDSWASDPSPVGFVLGSGELRAGLDQQLRGLVAGDRAEIVLGSQQAFGSEGDGSGAVPPDSPVAYLVDVFGVVDNP